VELISRRLAGALGVAKGQEVILMVRFMGSARSVVAQTAQALKVLREANIQCTTHDEDDTLWRKLAAVSLKSEGELSWRVGVRPGDLMSFLSDLAEVENDEASQVALRWHAGLGDGRLRAIGRAPVYHRETVRVLEQLRQKTTSLGGRLILENAPIEIKNEFEAWGNFGSVTELMKRVKRELDPNNMLSPGRFSEGL
jgi:glycolate oxidase FAD binding subunit